VVRQQAERRVERTADYAHHRSDGRGGDYHQSGHADGLDSGTDGEGTDFRHGETGETGETGESSTRQQGETGEPWYRQLGETSSRLRDSVGTQASLALGGCAAYSGLARDTHSRQVSGYASDVASYSGPDVEVARASAHIEEEIDKLCHEIGLLSAKRSKRVRKDLRKTLATSSSPGTANIGRG